MEQQSAHALHSCQPLASAPCLAGSSLASGSMVLLLEVSIVLLLERFTDLKMATKYVLSLLGAVHEVVSSNGSKARRCATPHSLRATSTTLLLDNSGIPIEALPDLLHHKHITNHVECKVTTCAGAP